MIVAITPAENSHGFLTPKGLRHASLIHSTLSDLVLGGNFETVIVPGEPSAMQTAEKVSGKPVGNNDDGYVVETNLHWSGERNPTVHADLATQIGAKGLTTTPLVNLVENMDLMISLARFAIHAKDRVQEIVAQRQSEVNLLVMHGVLLQATLMELTGEKEPFVGAALSPGDGFIVDGNTKDGWAISHFKII